MTLVLGLGTAYVETKVQNQPAVYSWHTLYYSSWQFEIQGTQWLICKL